MRDEDKDGGRRLQLEKTEDDPKCAVPENIHTPPPSWRVTGNSKGGGGPEAKISKG